MTHKIARTLSVRVAVTGLPVMLLTLIPHSVRAQYYAGENGHKLDNSNLVGSGGSNGELRSGPSHNDINNAIVTGNVTGLNYFHDKVATYDVNNFQGTRATLTRGGAFAGSADRLNAYAGPVDYVHASVDNPSFTTYYNAQRYTSPIPSNMMVGPGGGTLVPTPTIDPLAPSTDIRLTTQLDPTRFNLPVQGELNVAGPVDPTGAASLYRMSPLYGVIAQDNAGQGGMFQSRISNSVMPQNRSQMTPAQIAALKEELSKTVVPEDQNNTAPGTTNTPGATNSPGTSTDLNNGSQINNSALSTQLPAQNLNAGAANTTSVQTPGNLATGQGIQSQAIIPANKQSKQIKALEDKYNKLKRPLTDVEAADKLNAEERALHSAGQTPKTGQPAEVPGVTPVPNGAPSGGQHDAGTTTQPTAVKPVLPPVDSAAENQPYVITSLATGIPAKGLADLMKSAEDKMRQGKFTEAVDTYETAQAVAANNPFVYLGRSFAEIGASYYGKADQDLTRAVASEPALLAGKYDLNGFLGEDRVKFVVKDLQDIASHEKSGRPLVLLGFIAHNTGDDAAATKYLDQAAPRGGYDSIIALMRSTWSLKSAK